MQKLPSYAATFLLLATAACAGGHPVPAGPTAVFEMRSATNTILNGDAIGFSVDTPKRAANAAREGIDATILYGGAPAPGSALEQALSAHGISVVDAGISDELYAWECHRTHTVAKPPGYANYYCTHDYYPGITEQMVLAYVKTLLAKDAQRSYVSGYWVLDDWPGWDGGSARTLLQEIHADIARATPGRPAICGFAGTIEIGNAYGWDPTTAKNYSNAGCDAVGWYNYTPFGIRKPVSGTRYNWSMHGLLSAMARSLEKQGWSMQRHPLIGIGQAWGGAYGSHYYQPGLDANELIEQASAYCAFGSRSIAWYAWDDSGFNAQTLTPNNSQTVASGIAQALAGCRSAWQQSGRT